MRRTAWVSAAVVVPLLILLWFFYFGGPWPFADAEIVSAEVDGEGSVTLIVDSCNGNPSVARLEETDGEVRVAVSATQYHGYGGDCQDALTLHLAEPLGDRTLINLTSGRTVSDLTHVEGG